MHFVTCDKGREFFLRRLCVVGLAVVLAAMDSRKAHQISFVKKKNRRLVGHVRVRFINTENRSRRGKSIKNKERNCHPLSLPFVATTFPGRLNLRQEPCTSPLEPSHSGAFLSKQMPSQRIVSASWIMF